ncbi:MAG: hypothetical protein IT311_03810 [Anaerolineales bacterium]|nr:hypothetical protein [Anaerolineales bacterium]MCZ2121567.1 hypothetical protein [Anaerolineales bacterium]
MSITTYEGIVEKGKIRLKSGVKLPDNVKVYVIVMDAPVEKKKAVRILSPRIVRKEQASKLKMRVSEERSHA